MALIRNQTDHGEPLSDGRVVAPGATVNAAIGELEQSLIDEGRFLIVDGAVAPPLPPEPFAHISRRVFYSSVQPAELRPGDIWRRTDPTTYQVVEELEAL